VVVYEAFVTKTSKPLYKYKILNYKYNVVDAFGIYPSYTVSVMMVTKGDRNMYEVYNV